VIPVETNSAKEMYIVINSINSQEHQLQLNKDGRSPVKGLLMMILGLLWCADNRKLSEEELWKQLALVDVKIKPGKDHPQLGDVQSVMKCFELQLLVSYQDNRILNVENAIDFFLFLFAYYVDRYLHSEMEIDADAKKIKYYSSGPRAILEVGKVQILNFVCKVSPSPCRLIQIKALTCPLQL
jgi:hypothetical protein